MEEGVPNVNVGPVAPYPAKDIVHEVKNVFIYIPAELSATGFELKINGFVRIVKKVCTCKCSCMILVITVFCLLSFSCLVY